MAKKKRNHWVPQVYLRSFAADIAERRKIWTFGNNDGDPELKPIENVAVKFYLYAPRDKNGERQYAFEDKLASLEQMFASKTWSNICTDFVDLSNEDVRKLISLLAAVMFLRNPSHLENTKFMHRHLVEFYSKFPELPDEIEIGGIVYPVNKDTWPAYRDADEDALKRAWIKGAGSAVWLAELLLKMRWSVLFSEHPSFITSDNPITITHPSLTFKGLSNPQTTVFFPVSPTRVIVMDNRLQEPANQYYPAQDIPGMNTLLWRNALDRMFSSRHPDEVCQEIVLDAGRKGFSS